MKYFSTVERAKEEIKILNDFVSLAENYEVYSLEQQIIKLYAFKGSIREVSTIINSERSNIGQPELDISFISNTIQSKAQDPLHRLVKANYLKKTKHFRKKPSRKADEIPPAKLTFQQNGTNMNLLDKLTVCSSKGTYVLYQYETHTRPLKIVINQLINNVEVSVKSMTRVLKDLNEEYSLGIEYKPANRGQLNTRELGEEFIKRFKLNQ